MQACKQPESIEIEIDSRCNLRCSMCAVSNTLSGRPQKSLAPAALDAMLEHHFPDVERLTFIGYSEPLLHPGLLELVRVARARGRQVTLATNGLLLGPALARELLASGVDEFAISFDTTDPSLFRRIRGVARHAVVVDNVRSLRRAIDDSGLQAGLELRAVLGAENLGETEALIRFAANERAGIITFVREMPLGRTLESLYEAYAGVDWPRLAALAVDLGLRIHFSSPDPLAVRRCEWATRSTYVTVEGEVAPCQIAALDPEYRFGNLENQRFGEIHAGPGYSAFRAGVARGDIPPPCRGCACVFDMAEGSASGARA
jgi:radical SAM protein with 4Fe4S-binding SPASM domain